MLTDKIRKFTPEFITILAKDAVFFLYKKFEKILVGPFDKYDFQTKEVIEKVLAKNANWVDIGAHKGHILRQLLQKAPNGEGFAFEPIPSLNQKLQANYGKKVKIYDLALSDSKGEKTFTLFVDRPAVSGFNKRVFEHEKYVTKDIIVQVDKLDNIVAGTTIDLIKIDVEGAELEVLKGAENTIRNSKPVILFEFGLGGSDLYGTTPEMMYDYLTDCGLVISTQEYFLKGSGHFNKVEFVGQFTKSYNYFFIAYDPQKKYF